jgi:hypothetical protein
MDVGTKLRTDLMQEIGTGVLYTREQIDSLNVIRK